LFEVQPELEAWSQIADAVDAERLGSLMDTSTLGGGIGARIQEILPQLPKVEWAIERLVAAGIPLDDALNLLIERNALYARHFEWTHSDLERYMELFYIVDLCQGQAKNEYVAPYELVKLAAGSWAKGNIDFNAFLIAAGLGLLEFQVWRGPKFLDAFKQSQVATHRAARQMKQRFEKVIDDYLKDHPEFTAEAKE
jgi:hypothetical protein